MLEELMSQPLIQTEDEVNESPAKYLSVAMSQINLREGEIKELKEGNVQLKHELDKIIEEINKLSGEKKQLQKRINELNGKMIGKLPLQGAKHLIWDTLTIEITKFRSYLNFVNNKNAIVDLALQRCKLVNENLDKKPLETAQNDVKFLKKLTYEDMQETTIRDRLSIILWARKFINKYNFFKVVQEKANQMLLEVKDFKKMFQEQFDEGLPPL